MQRSIKSSPSFQLMPSKPVVPNFNAKDKHYAEFSALQEEIETLDRNTKEILHRISRLHKKRMRFATQITNIVHKTQEDKKEAPESRSVVLQKERISRLSMCTRLLDNKYKLSSLIRNKPLPELQPSVVDQKAKVGDFHQFSDSLCNFLRVAQPEMIAKYFMDTALPALLCFSNEPKFEKGSIKVDLKEFIQTVPRSIASVPAHNRILILQKIIDVLNMSSLMTTLFEETALLTDPVEILLQIERVVNSLLKCKRSKLLIPSDMSPELVYIHNGVKRTVPLTTGLIAETVKKENFRLIEDPLSLDEIDIAVESSIFDGSKNAIIAPLYHPEYKGPFVIVGIDKLVDESFSPSDYVYLYFLFQSLSVQIKTITSQLSSITETDITNLVQGLSEIAAAPNAHDMIQKTIDVGNKLTKAATTRLFTIVNDCLCEETPGTKLGGKMIPIDRGLVCKAAIEGKAKNFFLPRREKDFSVAIDDITEPRVWSMVAAPTTFSDETKGALVFYNREGGTFFSSKEMFVVSNLSKCVSSLLYTCCECSKLHESLDRNNVNIIRSYNLTVFALKSIRMAGSSNLFRSMKSFCSKLRPAVEFRFLIYENDKLTDAETGQSIPTEPQILDAICNMKPTAATMLNVGVLVLPIKQKGSKQINLFEFRAPLMQLKSEEESNGIIQRSRILQALEEHTTPLELPKGESLHMQRNMFSRQSSAFFNVDANQTGSNNLPFIPLSLKSIHEENINSSSTSLFDLSHDQHTSDKFIIVSSARPSARPASFETQLDDDTLQIYPFDPFLTSILQSFSVLSSRQLTLHNKIVSMSTYKSTLRALHLLGNVLSCPMTFSNLLEVMMNAFTSLFGKGVSLKIFDPPLRDASETDPTALNLERDRMIIASIKIPETMTANRSTALAAFADLISALMANRTNCQIEFPIFGKQIEEIPFTLDLQLYSKMPNDIITMAKLIFCKFHVHDVLNCSEDKIVSWLKKTVISLEDRTFFARLVDAIQFLYVIFTELDLFDKFNESELAAICISTFMSLSYPKTWPGFKYAYLLEGLVDGVTPQVLIRVTTALINLANPFCDLLEDTPFELAKGLTELLIQGTAIYISLLSSRFIFVTRKGINFEEVSHRRLFAQFVSEFAQFAPFFRPNEAFSEYCYVSKEMKGSLLMRAEKLLPIYVKAIESVKEGTKLFSDALSGKVDWINSQEPSFFMSQQEEPQEEENMSLFDAR